MRRLYKVKFLARLFLLISIAIYNTSVSSKIIVKEAPSPVNAKYVEASSIRILQDEEKIASLFNKNNHQEFIIQRISKSTYWVQKGFYSTIFYVGSKGVLLFDPLGWRGESIQKAIASVTKLPISAIVYSHNHADHIGDILKFVEVNSKLRIIASRATQEQQAHLNSNLPKTNEVISWPTGSFVFEDLTVELHGFERASHSRDHGIWLLKEEKIAHIPDLINPDQPPFWAFAGSETFLYYEENIEQLAQLEWKFFNGGHGNIGSRKDIEFYREFLKDLKSAVVRAMQNVVWGTGVDTSKLNAHTPYLPAWLHEISKQATDSIRSKYGNLYGFEAATMRNAEMIALALFDYK